MQRCLPLIASTLFASMAQISIAAPRVSAPISYDASRYNIEWNSLGKDFNDSMPVGNGDLGLNVWTEQNGDIVMLVGKTDAYTENGQIVKLGRVRVSLTPNPFTNATSFSQTLDIQRGEIDIAATQPDHSIDTVRIWVDANHPVAHIEEHSLAPLTMNASTEIWRLTDRVALQGGNEVSGIGTIRELNNDPNPVTIDADTILPAQGNAIAVCHFNKRSTYPLVLTNQHLDSLLAKYPDPLLHRTFGMLLKGPGFASTSDQALAATAPQTYSRLDLYALTQTADSPQTWRAAVNSVALKADAVNLEAARVAHRKWWSDFWNRSWIDVTGTPDADKVSQSYAMMRYMDAAGGRGAIPIKYNGSIFTVGQEPAPGSTDLGRNEHSSPDYRSWGGNFWAQNQRQVYWPMVASGDYDLLAPYIAMYRNALPLEIDRNKLYWNHDGASYPETMYFWGTPNNNDFHWNNPSDVMQNTWIRNHFTGGIETTAIMLSEYDNTQDVTFAKSTLMPIADAVTTFFDEHWPRDADGKIHMDPAQAIETYQQSVNPTTDIAGLMNILPRLLALPSSITTPVQRTRWKKMLADLPPIPTGTTGADGKLADWGKGDPAGKPIILPAEKYSRPANVENPELYAVFPFRIYGVGYPSLDLARNTYAARRFISSTCWGQDGEETALLGLTDEAKAEVVANFTAYGWQRYKWFWKPGHDWTPDIDNGGAGMETLQLMLMQCDPGGKRIQLMPAWPADWSGDFKLHAPYNTTVAGTITTGKLTTLTVTPPSRTKDVVIVGSNSGS